MRPFRMAFPATVEEACELLGEREGAHPIAGGTALTVLMKEGVYTPELLVNLRRIDELRYVEADDEVIRIGALTTLRELERHPSIQGLPAVEACLGELAGVRLRNSATIGGHLAHADLHLDLPPVLSGLDAGVVLADGSSRRELPLEEFLVGYYETALEPGELLTELLIPVPPAGTRGAYRKHRYYSSVDWPCVGVAAFAVSRNGGFEDIRVLLNSVGETPVTRIEGVEKAADEHLSPASITAVADLAEEQVEPIGDLRGSADYKRRMAGVFVRRALEAVAEGGA